MRRPVAAALGCLVPLCFSVGAVRACTCLTFETPGGPIFGANLDLSIPGDGLVFINRRGVAKEGLQAGTSGERARWVSKYGSVTFSVAGREFAIGGMNEAGLVVGSMELRASKLPEPDGRPPLAVGRWIQYVLDNCSSVEEVLGLDTGIRIQDTAPPSHYLVADAGGGCAAIEWIKGKFVAYTGDALPVRVMTNMRYTRALAALRRGGPRWWWSNPEHSAERFADAQSRCEAYDPGYDTDAVRYTFGTLTGTVSAPHTKWNIVYDLAKREVWYRTVVSPAIRHVALDDFDLSCEAPLLMLNVNAMLEGDVAASFEPYDRDVNLAVFRTFCDRYELDVSSEVAEAIVEHFDRYDCAR